VFRLLVALEWSTLRTASAVFATNESFRRNALDRGVKAERITVVRNGPSAPEIVGATSGEIVPRHDGHRIVYVGVLGQQDNVEGAVLAAHELIRLRGRGGWRMVIAGDGETMPALTKLVAERGLSDVVEFVGWLDTTAVDALLRSGTVGIQPDLPTRMNDLSTMAKTVEYVARGLPVVAADLTETRRTAGDAAVYVPHGTPAEFATAINDLLDDPAARQRMRETGLARFGETLSWEHQAVGYIAVWDRLLVGRLRRRSAAAIPAPLDGNADRIPDAAPAEPR
jgi:glycosyltransferase involved in cell wall biosynthesis